MTQASRSVRPIDNAHEHREETRMRSGIRFVVTIQKLRKFAVSATSAWRGTPVTRLLARRGAKPVRDTSPSFREAHRQRS